jgi:glucose-6-phosphate 1-dehydrogenase
VIEPTTYIIFGATGDLAQGKLLPALFDLKEKGMLPAQFKIVAFSRRPFSDEEFRQFSLTTLAVKKQGVGPSKLASFLELISYVQGTFDEEAAYPRLGEALAAIDQAFGICANKLFHLAVHPEFYEVILNNLAASGLSIPCGGNLGWTRVLVEKPFGRDTETAQKLDRLLGSLFQEEQIFRIDHYLAKETLQNILTFRFSNSLFEPLWNNEFIASVKLSLFEQADVSARGDFYDTVGALRDVGQNHLLQMLALVALDFPGELSTAAIRSARAKVLADLSCTKASRAQYEGFTTELGVDPDSTTETYFALEAGINSPRWQGVPFYLESGKGVAESQAEIVVTFKDKTTQIKTDRPNQLIFRLQPDEGISVLFWLKKPGLGLVAEPQYLTFNYANSPDTAKLPDAYERVLLDAFRGDQTLFTSTEEMMASWRFITPILAAWQNEPLLKYQKGVNYTHYGIRNH